jgi:hypothetical protein
MEFSRSQKKLIPFLYEAAIYFYPPANAVPPKHCYGVHTSRITPLNPPDVLGYGVHTSICRKGSNASSPINT